MNLVEDDIYIARHIVRNIRARYETWLNVFYKLHKSDKTDEKGRAYIITPRKDEEEDLIQRIERATHVMELCDKELVRLDDIEKKREGKK